APPAAKISPPSWSAGGRGTAAGPAGAPERYGRREEEVRGAGVRPVSRPAVPGEHGTVRSPAPVPVQRSGLDPSGGGLTLASVPGGSGGESLPTGVRSTLERRLGATFANVRVHADASAGQTSLGLGARAFTRGNDIYFAPGHYQP